MTFLGNHAFAAVFLGCGAFQHVVRHVVVIKVVLPLVSAGVGAGIGFGRVSIPCLVIGRRVVTRFLKGGVVHHFVLYPLGQVGHGQFQELDELQLLRSELLRLCELLVLNEFLRHA